MRMSATLLLTMALNFISGAFYTPALAYEQNANIARTNPPLLNCEEAHTRVNTMLDLHYQFNNFSEELFARTIKKIAETFDPNKIYFIQTDLDHFTKKSKYYLTQFKNNNCVIITDIYNLFIKRIHERTVNAQKILRNKNELNKLEYISLKQNRWSNSFKEVYTELKKKIQIQIIKENEEINNKNLIENKVLSNYIKYEKKMQEMNNEKLLGIFLNSFAQALDPHSSHMLPAEHDSFVIHISNKLEGIGAQLSEKDGQIFIRSLVTGGVAEKDGRLKIKDRILAIDAGDGLGFQDLANTDVENAVNSIRGRKGTTIKLLIQRQTHKGFERFNIALIRDEIELKDDTVSSSIIETKYGKIGLIKVPTFYTDIKCKIRLINLCKGVSYDTEKELKKLTKEGIQGIIINIRNNGGGDFPESIKLTSLFIPSGTIIQTIDKSKTIRKIKIDENPWIYKGPLVVLINRFSASASEIFAAAIQDYGRGVIVGDKSSYGKATVQIVQEIPGTLGRKTDGALKVTQSKFYRVTGKSNQKSGVIANINIPSILEEYDIGEMNLEYSLPIDSIPPIKEFKPLQDLSYLNQKLKLLSQERLQKNPLFIELLTKINLFKHEKEKPIPIAKNSLKKIQEYQNIKDSDDEFEEEKKNSGNDNDFQLSETIQITQDIIKLTGNTKYWLGFSDKN